jgi:phospholipid N-methyltransferase
MHTIVLAAWIVGCSDVQQTADVADALLALARVQAGDVVYDIGTSDNQLTSIAAAKYGARAQRVEERDWLTVDVASATVVVLSLPVELTDRVGERLRRALRPGSRIVSRGYAIGSWKPDSMTRTADGTPLYLWIVPRRPARDPDILFVPTREAVADQMLQLAGITASDVVFDLGSGDGRIVNLAAQKYGARGVGIEIDPPLVEIARQVARDAGIADRVTFIEADLFSADLSTATVVTLYLSPSVNRKLEPKLRRELKPGTRVVSHQFPMDSWEPDRIVRAEDGTNLYLWTVRATPRTPAPRGAPYRP